MSGGALGRAAPAALLLAIVFSVRATPARAAALPHWANDAIAGNPLPAPQDEDAIIALDRTEAKVGADLATGLTRRFLLYIRNGNGAAHAVMRVVLEPGGRLSDIHAWTVGAAGVRAEAGRSSSAEGAVNSEGYSDVRQVLLRGPDVRSGDWVAFEASWTQAEPLPLHDWFPQEVNLPVLRAELEMELPRGWTASVHGYHLRAVLPATQAEHVSLALDRLASVPEEPLSPDYSALAPRVVIRYRRSSSPAEFDRWESIATWYQRLSQVATARASCPADLADGGGGGPAGDRIADVAQTVQRDVRYVAIELGMQRWVPDAAGATWSRRYGDCKDKAALMVSALAAKGIEARPMLVCTRSRGEVDPGSPDPLQFNHCIVAIDWPSENFPVAATVTGRRVRHWTLFDPTDTDVPLGAISNELGGTWGVIADSSEGLVRLPEATASTMDYELRAKLAPDGSLSGRLTLWIDGPGAEALLARFAAVAPDERRHRAGQFLTSRWQEAVLDSCGIETLRNGAKARGMRMDFHLPAIARPLGRDWLVSPRLFTAWQVPAPRDTARSLPLVLGDPGVVEEHWDVELPADFQPEQRAPVGSKSELAEYTVSAGGTAGRLSLQRRLELHVRQLPPERYSEGRSLWRTIYSGDHPSILITRH